MTSTPKPRELPLSRLRNSQTAPLLERMRSDERLIKRAGRSSWAEQAASELETTLRRFPFQKNGSRQGMGRTGQGLVCPLLDTYTCFEVSTLKVFGSGLRTRRFIVSSRIAYSARREQRAGRASAAFCTGQKTGSNEILEKRCALYGQSRPVVRVAYPLIAPLTGFHRQGREWN